MAEGFLPLDDSSNVTRSDQANSTRRERIKHILVGKSNVVTLTIRSLHVLGYSEVREWSQLQPARELGEIGEVVSVLIRYVVSDT